MISFIMEEKVVRPPRNPVTRNAEARGEGEVLCEEEGEEALCLEQKIYYLL